jgi:uncharacterized protein (TIGR00369 family)
MEYKVIRKQYNSDMCFVCGLKNDAGLHTHYYELENQSLLGVFKGIDVHQSYPKRMHGGIISALLDETVGRAIIIFEPDTWGVTAELTIRYLKPVPLHEELKVVGKITNIRSRLFEGEGYVCDSNQNILATCTGKYIKQSVKAIIKDSNFVEEEWIFVEDSIPPMSFDLPK